MPEVLLILTSVTDKHIFFGLSLSHTLIPVCCVQAVITLPFPPGQVTTVYTIPEVTCVCFHIILFTSCLFVTLWFPFFLVTYSWLCTQTSGGSPAVTIDVCQNKLFFGLVMLLLRRQCPSVCQLALTETVQWQWLRAIVLQNKLG